MNRATATTDPAETPHGLVAALWALNEKFLELQKQWSQARAKVIALGVGKYSDGNGHELTVAKATPGKPEQLVETFELSAEDVDAAKGLAGPKFNTLFERRVVWLPIDGFNHVVPTHLTPAKAANLIDLCRRIETKPATKGRSSYVTGLPKNEKNEE